MLADHLLQGIPHFRTTLLDQLLDALDGGDGFMLLEQLPKNKRFEQLQSHLLWQTALVEFEFRPHHDDRAAGIIHTLPQEVLAKPALLPLQHIGEGLERTIVLTLQGPPSPPVVEKGVHCLLEHPLFIADDDIGGPKFHEPLQPIIPVDDPTVEVVQIGCGKTASI